jgi:hypothetical protein
MQFLINQYSLICTCWTVLGWEGHCTNKNMLTMTRVYFTKNNFTEDKVHLFVGSI